LREEAAFFVSELNLKMALETVSVFERKSWMHVPVVRSGVLAESQFRQKLLMP
jgi:hypothetical protein